MHLATTGTHGMDDDPHDAKENFKLQVPVGERLLLSWLPACRRGLPWPGWASVAGRWLCSVERFVWSCGIDCSQLAGRSGESVGVASSTPSSCTWQRVASPGGATAVRSRPLLSFRPIVQDLLERLFCPICTVSCRRCRSTSVRGRSRMPVSVPLVMVVVPRGRRAVGGVGPSKRRCCCAPPAL